MIKLGIPTYREQVIEFLRDLADDIDNGVVNLRGFQIGPYLEISESSDGLKERQECQVTCDLKISFSQAKIELKKKYSELV